MAAWVAPAIAATASGIQSAFQGAASNNSAAQTTAGARNYDWWKTINQRIWQLQDFNLQNAEDWKRIEYDSPVNQRRRLIEAGINPALAMEHANLNGASGQSTPSIGEPPYGGNVSPSYFDLGAGFSSSMASSMDSIANMLVAQSQVRKNDAEAGLAEIDAKTRAAFNDAQVNSLVRQGKLTDFQAKGLKLQNDFLQKTMNDRVLNQSLGNDFLRYQMENLNEQNLLYRQQRELNSLYAELQVRKDSREERQLNALFSKISAEIGLMSSQSNYYGTLSESEVIKSAGQVYDNVIKFYESQNAPEKVKLINDQIEAMTRQANENANVQSQMASGLNYLKAGLPIGMAVMSRSPKQLWKSAKNWFLGPAKIGF